METHLEMENQIARVKAFIQNAKKITVLTGAGISHESGIPTFRGQDGLWKKFRAEDLATNQAFQSNPKLVWEWYDWRRGLIRKVKPNAGHYALVSMENHISSFTLITQNVDGLHRLAGSKNVFELHGNIWRVKCLNCHAVYDNFEVPISKDMLPRCKHCGGLIRPDVVWFGESLPENTLKAAMESAIHCNLMLVVGTSGIVQPVASLPSLAKSKNAYIIEVNPNQTPISLLADESIRGKAAETLPGLV